MIIVEDTRNQAGKHKLLNENLNKLGYAIVRSKLYVGDYSRLDDMTTCIDTKKDWIEVAGNICGKQHTRFREECKRAQDAGIKLIILVEEKQPVEEWICPLKRNKQKVCLVDRMVLSKAMKTMSEKYGVVFKNCAKEETANEILKLLKREEKIKWQEKE